MGYGSTGVLALFALFGLFAVMQSSCSDSSDAGGGGSGVCGGFALTEEEAEHACAHLVEGPFGELANGEPLANLHMLYTVTLEPSGDAYVASLPFVPRESAVHALIVLEAGVPVRILQGDTELCLEPSEPEGCADISAAHLVELDRNQEVTIEIGPTSSPTVRLVAERQ